MDPRLRRATPHHVRRQAIRRKTQHCHSHFYSRCSHWSFCAPSAAPIHWMRERWILAGGSLLLALLTLIGLPVWAGMMHHAAPRVVARQTLALKLPPPPPEPALPPVENWKTVTVDSGQTLSDIFQGLGLSGTDVARVMASGKDAKALRSLHPGDELSFLLDAKGRFKAIRFDRDAGTQITLTGTGPAGPLTETVITHPAERRMHFAHGVIQGSLFAAGEKAGLNEVMVLKLADVFKYDIDFVKDIRPGDHFTVVYDDVYRDGAFARSGSIIAAEFFNRGHRFTAYRFEKPDGDVAYYSEDGRPLKKALLRTPVAFTRISSRFGMRKDPVLGFTRLHKGVDYAAPIGTPIHAAGSGVITVRGRVHGFGNFIAIRNTPKFTTEYGHMSRFAPGLHVGSHVTQGEVIGYVGQTGFATGPHLHYQVMVDGRAENPLTITMPKPEPLSGKLMADFRQQTSPLVARIQMIDATSQRLARVDSTAGGTTGAAD
jgi:murein DD-endopeptidase MepM/ murein hydrolase activator NlpD